LLVGAAMRTARLKFRVSAPMCENRDRAECGKPGTKKSSFAGRNQSRPVR